MLPFASRRSMHQPRLRGGIAASLAALLMTIAASTAARAALPDTLPYGQDLPVPPSPRVNVTPPKVVDLLGARLKNPYTTDRVQAIAEIGACELPAGAKYVRQAMADPDPQVRAQAARVATMVGDPTLAADLKKLQADADPAVRREVALAAGAMGDDAILSAALTDADPSVVLAAVTIARAAQADQLDTAMTKYPPATQVAAIRSLGRIGDARHAAAVAAFLEPPRGQSNSHISVLHETAALEAIGRMKANAHLPAVLQALSAQHPTVRRSALGALAAIAPADQVQPHAITALADADTSVRENAARVLQKFPTATALEALVKNLPAESSRLHEAAREAIVLVGQSAIPTAEKMLTDTDPRRREDGSYVLGRLKADAGFDTHVKLLTDADWGLVKQAAQSLGQIARPDAAGPLAELAKRAPAIQSLSTEENGAVAIEAVEQAIVAATYLGEKSILPVCRQMLADQNRFSSALRSASAYAIGRLGDPADGKLPAALTRISIDPEEAESVRLECVKALGHLKLAAAKAVVGTDRGSAVYTGGRTGDWLSHWVRYRLTGQELPYVPLPDEYTARLSIAPIE